MRIKLALRPTISAEARSTADGATNATRQRTNGARDRPWGQLPLAREDARFVPALSACSASRRAQLSPVRLRFALWFDKRRTGWPRRCSSIQAAAMRSSRTAGHEATRPGSSGWLAERARRARSSSVSAASLNSRCRDIGALPSWPLRGEVPRRGRRGRCPSARAGPNDSRPLSRDSGSAEIRVDRDRERHGVAGG